MAQFGLVIKTKTFHKRDNMQSICSVPSKPSDSGQTMNSDQLQAGQLVPHHQRGEWCQAGGSHHKTSITAGLKTALTRRTGHGRETPYHPWLRSAGQGFPGAQAGLGQSQLFPPARAWRRRSHRQGCCPKGHAPDSPITIFHWPCWDKSQLTRSQGKGTGSRAGRPRPTRTQRSVRGSEPWSDTKTPQKSWLFLGRKLEGTV